MRRLSTNVALASAALLVAAAVATTSTRTIGEDPADVIAHEWGTFTSIAGRDGRAVPWRPLSGPPDLPSFVRHAAVEGKGTLTATVRMETPVLYFYAERETAIDVTVGFSQGFITEYFPRAVVSPSRPGPFSLTRPGHVHTIAWRDVRVQPGVAPDFPVEGTPNHYYAARDTNAAPLAVGPDRERFLFYRGVGSFALPLRSVVAENGEVDVANTGSEPIPAVMLFENRRGRIGWRVHRGLTGQVRFAPATPGGDIASLRAELERLLADAGLYDEEAAAMVETWSDTWFEEGTRLFYLLPRRAVDSILTLDIRPAASDVVRVFVGRLELVTAATLTDLRNAFRTSDRARLATFRRFLRPFADRLLEEPLPAADRARVEALLEAVSSAAGAGAPAGAPRASGAG